jgi:hypothetical protein
VKITKRCKNENPSVLRYPAYISALFYFTKIICYFISFLIIWSIWVHFSMVGIRASQDEAKIETNRYLNNPRKSFLFIFYRKFEKNNFENFQKNFEFFSKYFEIRNFQMPGNSMIYTHQMKKEKILSFLAKIFFHNEKIIIFRRWVIIAL